MKFKSVLTSLALAMAVSSALPALHAAGAVKNVVITTTDSMKFSVDKIVASPGERIHIQLRNDSSMPPGHNWVLLKSDSDATSFAMAAIPASGTGYMPKALLPEVIASIPMLAPKQVGDVTFTCPQKPGKYPFICSCNGHSLAGMRGELIVK